MQNASHAFLDAVRKSMHHVRAAVGSATIKHDLLTAAERIQYKSYLRRKDANSAILKQAETGVSIKVIVRLTGHSRGLVRAVLRGQRTDVFRVRESSLEHHLPWLDASGLLVIVTAPTCGVASKHGASTARCGSLQNGRPAVDAPKRSTRRACSACHPPEPSLGS
jgi:hypothetical protein